MEVSAPFAATFSTPGLHHTLHKDVGEVAAITRRNNLPFIWTAMSASHCELCRLKLISKYMIPFNKTSHIPTSMPSINIRCHSLTKRWRWVVTNRICIPTVMAFLLSLQRSLKHWSFSEFLHIPKVSICFLSSQYSIKKPWRLVSTFLYFFIYKHR